MLLYLEVAEHLGLIDPSRRRDLAIASCGNAALAAAVVAAAGGRSLHVFVPVDADTAVLARLEELGARLTVCPRVEGKSAIRPFTGSCRRSQRERSRSRARET